MPAKKENSNNKKRRNGKRNGVFGTITGGRVVSVDLFKRKKLSKELELEQSIQLNQKAEYMSLIRENEMRRLLREKHLDLDYQEQPPYVIPRD